MREIKFRAWNTMAQQWQTDYDGLTCDGRFLTLDSTGVYHVNLDVALVFQQYTGLKDKNGKEIYEGDVLRFTEVDEDSAFGSETTYVTEVKWIDDLAQWRVVFPDGRRTELHYVLQIPCFYDQEIIGNIYENPELINS